MNIRVVPLMHLTGSTTDIRTLLCFYFWQPFYYDFAIMDESKPTDTEASASQLPVINPEDLIGRSFLMDKQDDGQHYGGRIVQLIEVHESMVEDNPTRIKFRVSVNNDQTEAILT
jgi:hypothetical protein